MGRSLFCFQNCRIAPVLGFVVSGLCWWHSFQSVTQVCFEISISNFICMAMGRSLFVFSNVTKSKWPPGGHLWFSGFRTITLIWLWISSPNFSDTSLVCMERSPSIFSNVTSKMASWGPSWFFWFPDSYFSLALNIKSKLECHITCVYGKGATWFSAMSLSRWPHGGHIGFLVSGLYK